jgi:catechol-2,3-dioxygenase
MTQQMDKVAPKSLAHVALRVRDINRSVDFYENVVGIPVRYRSERAAFLGIREDTSHELALFPLGSEAEGPDPKQVGMYHIAWETDSFASLEQLHQRLLDNNTRIAGYSESQTSSNVMFLDPDGNELEFIWEPSQEELAKVKETGVALPKLVQAPTAV